MPGRAYMTQESRESYWKTGAEGAKAPFPRPRRVQGIGCAPESDALGFAAIWTYPVYLYGADAQTEDQHTRQDDGAAFSLALQHANIAGYHGTFV